MPRLILGVVAGFLTTSFVAVACDYAVRAAVPGAIPDTGHPAPMWLLVALAYSIAAAVVGGYVAAAVATAAPSHAGLWLGATMVVAGVAAASVRPESAPLWYHLVSLSLVVPAVMLGVALRIGRLPEIG